MDKYWYEIKFFNGLQWMNVANRYYNKSDAVKFISENKKDWLYYQMYKCRIEKHLVADKEVL